MRKSTLYKTMALLLSNQVRIIGRYSVVPNAINMSHSFANMGIQDQ